MAVFDHMRERLARFDIAGKGQEDRAGGILQLQIGDHHVEDRLRLGRDLVPDADGLEQPAAGGDDGGGARVAARARGERRIGDDDGNIGGQGPGAAPAPAPVRRRRRRR